MDMAQFYGTMTISYYISGAENTEEAEKIINETLDAWAESASPSELSWDDINWTIQQGEESNGA